MGCSSEQPFLLLEIKRSDSVYLALCFKKGSRAFGFGRGQDFCSDSFFTYLSAVHYDDAGTYLPYDVNVVSDEKECSAAFPVDVRHEL